MLATFRGIDYDSTSQRHSAWHLHMAALAFGRIFLTALFATLGASVLLFGCAGTPVVDSDGSAAAGGADSKLSLVFRPPTTLTITPRETRDLIVVSSPAGHYTVRFALLSGTGEGPADAALDHSDAETDDAGLAHVQLTAPSGPVTFTLRASIDDGPQTSLPISVSASGFADLEVSPSYSGERPVTDWVATVRAHHTCDELSGTPPPDGDLMATSEAPSAPIVKDVPVGPALAVTLRAGHYVGGCATVPEVKEGQRNQVVVPLNDRPIQFDMTTLALSFGFDRVSTAWDGELSQVIEQAKLAMLGTALDDLEATLDAMQQAVPDTETATFAAARSNRGWDAALKAVYSDNTILRDAAGQWMSAGTAELYAEDAFLGELAADDTDPLRAFLTLSKVAGYEPASAGFPSMAAASWSADSQDTLLVSSDLLWSPSKLLSVLAIAPALEQGSSQSVSQALAAELDCGLFAETLVDTGQPLGELYSGCGLSCAVTACRDGVALMWQRASEVSDQAQPLFALSSTGAATVGDEAEIVSLLGSWVARFAAENEAATATGPLKGDAIP